MHLLCRLLLCIALGSSIQTACALGDWHTPLAKRFSDNFAKRDGVGYTEHAIAFDGTTAVLGSPSYTSDGNGRALILEKSNGVWTQTSVLGPDADNEDRGFGAAVAVSGDTVAVSTKVDSYPSGAVCVFVRSGMSWQQQARITCPAGAGVFSSLPSFGRAIALQGDRLVIGAPDEDRVLVYARASGVWALRSILVAPVANQRSFGSSLALDGSRLLIGSGKSPQLRSAFLFDDSNGSWPLLQRFTPTDATDTAFASSLAIQDGVMLIASSRGGLLYERDGSTWTLSTTLVAGTTPLYECGVALDGANRAVLLMRGGKDGSRCKSFTRGAAGWTSHPVPDGGPGSAWWSFQLPWFKGMTAAGGVVLQVYTSPLLPDTRVVSATYSADAYASPQPARLQYKDAQFGAACALSSDTAAVGAPRDTDSHLSLTGAVYLYRQTAGAWRPDTRLTPGDSPDGASFGQALAIDGSTLVVGAPESDGWRGSAYVFVQKDGAWSQQARLEASSRAALSRFGDRVAVLGDTIAILAPGDETAHDQGCYVFQRTGSVWAETAQVTLGSPDAHGTSVAISSGRLWIGEPGASGGAGCVHEFRQSGMTWNAVSKLTAGMAKPGGFTLFGAHIATDGRQLIVSAARPTSTEPITPVDSYAFIFSREGSGWSPPAVLKGGYPQAQQNLPYSTIYYDTRSLEGPRSVSISGDRATLGLGQFPSNMDWGGLPEQTHCFTRTSKGWRSAGRVIANSSATSSTAWLGCSLYDALVPDCAIYSQSPDIVVQNGASPTFDWASIELPSRLTELQHVAAGTSVRRVFSILSTGATPLSGLRVSLKSATGGTARITQPTITTLAPGQHTTFAVTLIGQSEGDLSWTLEIRSNDPDDSPLIYQITATGTALPEPPTAEIVGPLRSFLNAPIYDTGTILGYATGSEPLRYQWMLNGRPIPGATSFNYLFPKPKIPGGRYTVVVTNPYGRAESQPFLVGYTVPVKEEHLTVEVGAAFSLKTHLIGAAETTSWKLDGNELADDELHTGSSTPTFRVRVAALNDAGTYTATVASPDSLEGEPVAAALVHVTVVERSVQVNWERMPPAAALTWIVGDQTYGGPFFTGDARTLHTYAADLPPGVGWDEKTGTFTGSPQRPGDYITRLRAFDRTGKSAVLNLLIHVLPVVRTQDLGTWYGLLDRDPLDENDLGGQITMQVTSNGVITGAVNLRGHRQPFIARLSYGEEPAIATASVATLWTVGAIKFRSDRYDGLRAHFRPENSAEEKPFVLSHAQPSPRTTTAIRFNVRLANSNSDPHNPRGDGFATVTVGRDGIRATGRLPDGAAFTCSTAALEASDEPAVIRFPVFQVLYGGTGSVLGWLWIDSSASTLYGNYLTQNKIVMPRTSGTYAAGFGLIEMRAAGAPYTAFRPGTLVPEGTPVAISLFVSGQSYDYGFTLSSKGVAQFDTTARRIISLTVNAATGAVSGLFHHTMESTFDASVTVRRDIPFYALIVPGPNDSAGYGIVPPIPPLPTGMDQSAGPTTTEPVQFRLAPK